MSYTQSNSPPISSLYIQFISALHIILIPTCPSLTFPGAADQTILLTLLDEIKTQDVKIDFAKIASNLGPHCSIRAVQERIKKLKKMPTGPPDANVGAATAKVTKKKAGTAKAPAATPIKNAPNAATAKTTLDKGKGPANPKDKVPANPKGKKRQRTEEPEHKIKNEPELEPEPEVEEKMEQDEEDHEDGDDQDKAGSSDLESGYSGDADN